MCFKSCIYFMSSYTCLTYITEWIWLLHCKYYHTATMLHRHTDPTFLYISTIIQPTATDALHIFAKYVPETKMPLKCHMYFTYPNYFMCRYQTILWVQLPHINSKQSPMSSQAEVYLHFTLLAYTSEQICLPHCTCTSHCTNKVAYV